MFLSRTENKNSDQLLTRPCYITGAILLRHTILPANLSDFCQGIKLTKVLKNLIYQAATMTQVFNINKFHERVNLHAGPKMTFLPKFLNGIVFQNVLKPPKILKWFQLCNHRNVILKIGISRKNFSWKSGRLGAKAMELDHCDILHEKSIMTSSPHSVTSSARYQLVVLDWELERNRQN